MSKIGRSPFKVVLLERSVTERVAPRFSKSRSRAGQPQNSLFTQNRAPARDSRAFFLLSSLYFQQISNCRGCPLRFFRGSGPQISNRKACLPKIFSENQVLKSQIARGVPLRFFQRSKSPNLKSQAVSP